jgi:hypothetical protein
MYYVCRPVSNSGPHRFLVEEVQTPTTILSRCVQDSGQATVKRGCRVEGWQRRKEPKEFNGRDKMMTWQPARLEAMRCGATMKTVGSQGRPWSEKALEMHANTTKAKRGIREVFPGPGRFTIESIN